MKKILHFTVISILALILCFTFIHAFIKHDDSNKIDLGHLLTIKQLDTKLNQDVLKIKNGLLKNFDSLTRDIKNLEKTNKKTFSFINRNKEDKPLFFINLHYHDTKSQAENIKKAVNDYQNSFKIKRGLIEDYKRNISVYRNSLSYIPTMVYKVSNQLSREQAHFKISHTIDQLLKYILIYNSSNDQYKLRKINETIGSIKQLRDTLPEDMSSYVNRIIKHSYIITEKNEEIHKILKQILFAGISNEIDKIYEEQSNYNKLIDQQAEFFQSIFYAALILLITYIFIIISVYLKKSRDAANEANKLKSEFLASISHELRTPMNGIIGTSEVLLDTKLSDAQKKNIQNIVASGENLLELLNDLLDFSKIESGNLILNNASFNLESSANEVLKLLNRRVEEKELAIKFNYDNSLSKFFIGDELRLKQILFNLIGNSIKFTEHGHIEISISKHSKGIYVSITDTGIGLSDEQQKIVFDKFMQADKATTREYGGTGLGLSICQQLVEMMGGKIGVTSQLGKGATFWFIIDLEECTSIENKNKELKSKFSINLQNTNILLAEDNRVNAEFTTQMLESANCNVELAKNGQIALEKATSDNKIDLILMDCDMPIMDGFEATKKIREFELKNKKPQITVVALTANAMKGDEKKCLDSGMNDYLTKPVKKEKLLQTIEKWINS